MKKTNTIFGKSDPGVSGVSLPNTDVQDINIDSILDEEEQHRRAHGNSQADDKRHGCRNR